MARSWTDEQRKAQSERAKDPAFWAPRMRPDGTPVKAEDTMRVSRLDAFRMQAESEVENPIVVPEQMKGDADVELDGEMTHTTPGLKYMWRKEHWGWRKVKVSAASVRDLLNNGDLPYCGDCGGDHDEGINDCPKREPRAYRVCPHPTCNLKSGGPKVIYDLDQVVEDRVTKKIRGREITDDTMKLATPEQRTRMRMDEHIRSCHEGLARAMGLFNQPAGVA